LYETQEHSVTIAVDTSAILAVLLNEPSRAGLIALTDGCSLISAPSLPWEVGNALIAGVRKRRLTEEVVLTAWASYGMIPVRSAQLDVGKALELAVALRVYAYDAYMLEAARSERAPLLTLDAALARAARSIGISVMELPK
jgi:predicted nucleic acid-binding protein